MKINRLIALFFTLAIMNLGADNSSGDAAATQSMRSPSPSGASVSFRDLKDGDVVATTFTVNFTVSGMGIAPAGSNIENTGHHHLLVDVDELPAMDQSLPKTDQIRHFGKGQSETKLTLPEGQHSLQLLLADYLHVPHEPPVMSEKITITVSASAPSPGDGS